MYDVGCMMEIQGAFNLNLFQDLDGTPAIVKMLK
jgi:hypothetical protein